MDILTGKPRPLFFLTALLCLPAVVVAAEADPLFRSGDVLDITLTGPFARIDAERDKEESYDGGTLSYMEGGREITLDTKFDVRGNYRLRKDICNYAQLWLDLDKDEVGDTLFAGQNRIKLVVQCRGGSRFERLVVKENQVYQMFNLLSDVSFRSRLVRVTYQDSERDRSRTHLGVLIENKDRLAHRVDLHNVDLNRVPYKNLDPVQANLVDFFMFMVANTDYSIISAPEDECCHNAKLFQPEGQDTYFPAPYDFDSSGYVDAPYAEPSPTLRLRSVRQRLYRGFCVPENIIASTLDAFRARRDDILAIAGDTTFVNARTAGNSVKYLDEFYEIIDDPKDLDNDILGECRGGIIE